MFKTTMYVMTIPYQEITIRPEVSTYVKVSSLQQNCDSGLPDGLFSNQKIPIWICVGGLGMENVSIFVTIWNILRPFGIFYGNLV
jgi:hypothetical protein